MLETLAHRWAGTNGRKPQGGDRLALPRREREGKAPSPPEDATSDAPAMDEMEVEKGFESASEMEE